MIAPASNKFFGAEPLTYCSDQEASVGGIVEIELNNNKCYGIILSSSDKPDFPTKPIVKVTDYNLGSKKLNFIKNLVAYYPNPIGHVASLFLPKKYYESRDADTNTKKPSDIKLSDQQIEAVKRIDESGSKTIVLHGITGSGKTRIYIKLALKEFLAGKSSLILVPEISLTPKIIKDFVEIFGEDSVVAFHSGLTQSQRDKIWASVFRSNKIIIGARSALFLPIKNLGLIVVDEFHDQSYVQESQPSYNAIKVAGLLSASQKSKLVLGSATPNITDYYQAVFKDAEVIKLDDKAISSDHIIDVKVIDLSVKADNLGSSNLISKPLLKQIEIALSNKKQTLIFINRRGTSRTILCSNCGWQSLCKNCNIPHVFHHDLNTYLCHECGQNSPKITQCPKCSSEQIFYKSGGTKLVEKELSSLFPLANIARFDKDNSRSEHIANRYQSILSGEIDIIIGTQILIKGHDFPKLGLVAMLQADSYLQYPDYTSKENLFQAVNQLYGRIDRGHGSGVFLIQTHSPENPTIKQAIANNWYDFYEDELQSRSKYKYPPFVYTLRIKHSMKDKARIIKYFDKLIGSISQSHPVLIDGPTPSMHQNKDGKWHYQIIVKSKDRSTLLQIIKELPGNCQYTIDPSHLL